MAAVAATFDPALISAEQAKLVVEDASVIEKMAATVCALAAARVADTSLWRAEGDRSAAHHLARTTGTSLAQAVGVLDTGRRLESLPEVSEAARRGELSSAQAAAITDAAAADPSLGTGLVEAARRSSLGELRDACARAKAAADGDAEARRRRIHARRYLRTFTDAEGAWNLHISHNPEAGADIMSALAPLRDRLFATARAEGRRESPEAYAADALVELARSRHAAPANAASASDSERAAAEPVDVGRATPVDAASDPEPADARPVDVDGATPAGAVAVRRRRSDRPAKIIARVDLEALLRGYPVPDEVCELMGYGPVAVSAIRDLIDSGDPFLAAVATRGTEVVGVAHLGRRANAHQQSALEWLYPACAVEGCSAVSRLENDHRADWADTHITLLDLLDRLCSHHHALKTRQGWSLVEGRGKRAFVAPGDPRHPGKANAVERPPPAASNGPPEAA